MIVTTIVSLFTARLTIRLLGVEDYGIQNVVSGIIGFMGVITGTMISATQRFLAYDLGVGKEEQYRRTFSMIINIFACFCLLSVLLLELVGPWFIATKLVIPVERLFAAQWLYQFTIIIFVLNTMAIPYTASIVAYERMGIYAYFTFLDVFFKLIVVFTLYVTPVDRLITIGFLTLVFTIITNCIYYYYCKKKLGGCRYIKFWDKEMFAKIGSYAGWNLLGSTTGVMNAEGQAIILNIFFGPVVNAAKAVADKINTIINSFGYNFYMAVSPQIIKSYASGDISYTRNLVLSSSRYAFYLLWILSLPLINNMEELLNLWLGADQVSYEMVRFCQVVLVYSLINMLEQPVTQAVRATGNIKKYQICIGIITLTFIPLCYIMFAYEFPAYYSMILLCIIYIIAQIVRVFIVAPIIEISFLYYTKTVIIKLFVVVLVSMILLSINNYFSLNIIVDLLTTFAIALFATIIFGLDMKERQFLLNYLHKKITK